MFFSSVRAFVRSVIFRLHSLGQLEFFPFPHIVNWALQIPAAFKFFAFSEIACSGKKCWSMQLLITCWIEQFGSFFLIETVQISQWLFYSRSIGYVIKAQVICLSPYWLLAHLYRRFQIAIQNLFCVKSRYYICSEKKLLSWKLILDWATVHHKKNP